MDILDVVESQSRLPQVLYCYMPPRDILACINTNKISAPDIRYGHDNLGIAYTAETIAGDITRRQKAAAQRSDPRPTPAKNTAPSPKSPRHTRPSPARERRFLEDLMDRLASLDQYYLFAHTLLQDGDHSAHWQTYCPNGGGYSLGLDTAALRQTALDQGFHLVKCIHDEAEQQKIVTRLIDDTLNKGMAVPPDHEDWLLKLNDITDQFFLQCIRLTAVFKHPSFYAGPEWRLFSMPFPVLQADASLSFTYTDEMLVPSLSINLGDSSAPEFPIQQVIVGPTKQIDLSAHSLDLLLNANGFTTCSVRLSNIPYKSW
jgi:hypothetical protein